MKTIREILGYVLGGLMFVLLVPAIMWFASLMPYPLDTNIVKIKHQIIVFLIKSYNFVSANRKRNGRSRFLQATEASIK